ncbi:MAG: hypothetical protein K2Y39_14305 [Candidatus Obscuribacterales bacterium]|nr:hypothetical protein [Candidatus Obscuribacterales bacterium]
MARSAEVSESIEAPVDSPQQNLVGDSLMNQSDSDLVRTAASGSQDDAIAMLDPKGNEFRIDGLNEDQEQNLQNQEASISDNPQEPDKPQQNFQPGDSQMRNAIRPDGAIASNSTDGLTKSVVSNEGESSLQFSPDGQLQSFTTKDQTGFTTTTNFDESGRATSRTITNQNGESQQVDVLRGTRVSDSPTEDGGREISISERGKINSFKLDAGGNIRESSFQQGQNSFQSRTFDARGNVESEFSRQTTDGITNSTFTKAGFRETTTVNAHSGETDILRENQLEPFSKRLSPSSGRTDNIHINRDGSSDATTTYRNEPGVSYHTRTGSDGRYQTDKVNDSTGEKWPYRQGSSTRRV